MSSSVKRPGANRPNRGGGRFNRKGRGGGGVSNLPVSVSRKNQGDFDEDDLNVKVEEEDVFDDDFLYNEEEEEGRKEGAKKNKTGDAVEKRKSRLKVDLQVLHMSNESQELARQTLIQLRGTRYEIKETEIYKDTGRRLDNRFWMHDRELVVKGGYDFTRSESKEEENNNFALKKLEVYGFHAPRCDDALSRCDGDFGTALEDLAMSCFDIKYPEDDDDDNEANDDQEQRDDEKMALESIYESIFVEKIQGALWEFKLKLPHLLKYLPKTSTNSSSTQSFEDLFKDPKICKFYLKGYCRNGISCRKKHVNRERQNLVDDRHLRPQNEDDSFYLEVRFPKKCRYPRDPPLTLIYTSLSNFPKALCLKISARLMEEAKAMSGTPCIFALVGILEDISECDRVIEGPDCPFSYDQVLPPKPFTEGLNSMKTFERVATALIGTENMRTKSNRNTNSRKVMEVNKQLKSRFRKNVNPMLEGRKQLPAWNEKDHILQTLRSHQVVVISGMTGCGKSTQVPQYILDEWLDEDDDRLCNIIVTQPRRLSAIGVAERVAQERNEKIGNTVGYQVRLLSRTSEKTRLLFCTTGILLRRLEGNSNLESVTHVIIDEVHERSEESDFMLMILRDLLPQRPDLKVLLMSATINADLFAEYFPDDVPVIDIPGKTFPVRPMFLEDILKATEYTVQLGTAFARPILNTAPSNTHVVNDTEEAVPKIDKMDDKISSKAVYARYKKFCDHFVSDTLSKMDFKKIDYDLIEKVLETIHYFSHHDGSILIFLPGMAEILTLINQLRCHRLFGTKAAKYKLIPLHGSLSSEEQSAVFSEVPSGIRKIVISTNLAETSITIEDCVYVIDSGRMKENRFESSKNMECLETVWVSQSSALQRKGRAGRVRPGFCFHLYTSFRFQHHFRSNPLPEIHRIPLEKTILRIKILPLFANRQLKQVLGNLIEPPTSEEVVSASVERLKAVSVLDADGNLTPLGYHVGSLPVDVRVGKLMIYGAIFRCLDSALTIAAILSHRSPFKKNVKDIKREFAGTYQNQSDQLAEMNAYNRWREICAQTRGTGSFAFAQEHSLSIKTLETLAEMKHQFVELLAEIGFISDKSISGRALRSAALTKGGSDAVIEVTGPEINANCDNESLLVSILCASLYPNIVQILSPELKYKQTTFGALHKPRSVEDVRFRTKHDGLVTIHPSSINYGVGEFKGSSYLVYHQKIKTSHIFIRDLSVVSVYPMILFGRSGIKVELVKGQFVISMDDGWIKFVASSQSVAELLRDMRHELDELLIEKIERGREMDLLTDPRGNLIIQTIVTLISKE